jgi:hypothetical protein
MANKTYKYEITWSWKEDGNRNIEEISTVTATTVPRAINKLVKELNDENGTADPKAEDRVRASDIMVIDVRSHQLNNAIIGVKKLNGAA